MGKRKSASEIIRERKEKENEIYTSIKNRKLKNVYEIQTLAQGFGMARDPRSFEILDYRLESLNELIKETYYFRALYKKDCGYPIEAIKDFTYLIENFKGIIGSAWVFRSECYFQTNQYAKAIGDDSFILEKLNLKENKFKPNIRPNYFYTHLNRGASRFNIGLYKDALYDFNILINELDEEKFSKSNDNPKLIKQLYENALNLKSLAHLYKGKIYTFYNNYSFAIKEFNKSLDLNPKNIRTYNFYKTNILLKNLYPKERKLYENKIKYLNTGLDNLALSLTKIDFLKKPFLFFDNIEISNPLLSFVNYIENYLVDDKQPFFNKYYYNFIYLTYHYLNKPEKSYNVLENIYNTDNQLKIFSFMDFYYYIQSSIKIAQPIVEIKKIISLAIKNAKEIEFIVLEPIEEYFKQLILELDCKNLDGLFVKSEIYPFYNEFQWSHNLSCLKVVLNDLQNVHKKNDIFNITYNKDFFKEAKDKDNEQFKNKFLNDFIYYALNTELEDTNINEVITVDEDNKSTLNNETFKLLFSKTMIKLKNIYGNEFEKIFNILDEDTKDDFKMLKWHHNKIFKYSEYISNKIEKGMDLKGILSILFFHYGNNNITSDNWVELNLYTYYLFILKRKNVKPNRIIELLKNKLFPIGVDAFLGIIVGIQSIYTVSVSISFFLINHINEKEELKKEEQSTPLSFSEFLDLDYLKNNIIIKENINLLKLNAKKMIKA